MPGRVATVRLLCRAYDGGMSVVRYSRFSDPVFTWGSLDHFVQNANWVDGIHAINFEGGHFDVLIRGDFFAMPNSMSLPVFLSGAVQRDGTAPPFFSGTTMARQAGVPVVSISDPTLHCSDSLSIGWYTGGAHQKVQEILAQFLSALRIAAGRELLLVGGSAGGFASLFYASRIGCSAFVWNPQTDLLHYGSWAVRDYLGAVLGDSKWAYPKDCRKVDVAPVDFEVARQELSAVGVASRVGSAEGLSRLVYLQNESDHHVRRHAEPFMRENGMEALGDGIYGDEARVVAVGPFAEGHRAPRRQIIEAGFALALKAGSDLRAGLKGLRAM